MGFGGVGIWEMVLIFLVVLLLFGAKRLPEIGASLGKGIREFKGSVREIEDEIKSAERQALAPGERPRSESSSARDGENAAPPNPGISGPEGGESREGEATEARDTSRLTTSE